MLAAVCAIDVTPTRPKAELELAIHNARIICAAPALIELLLQIKAHWKATDEPLTEHLKEQVNGLLSETLTADQHEDTA